MYFISMWSYWDANVFDNIPSTRIALTNFVLGNISKFEEQRKALAELIPAYATNPHVTLTC